MRRAAAIGASPNRITLLRDADGDGVAETRETFLEGLSQPFGMALLGDTFYVGNTDGVVAFPYTPGATRISAPGARLADLQARRALDAQPAAERRRRAGSMSASGRSATSARRGLEAEQGRACIYELDLASGKQPRLRLGPAQPGGPGVGAHTPARCGPWSTSATASATRRRPTT